jgi:hypothetical protein
VICANQTPDHTTIARFRQRHEAALAGLFGEVLALCAEAGLVDLGVLAVDSTKLHANASHHATRDYEQIAAEILEEADAVDAAEDERLGERRGDELPPELATSQGRRGWLREAKRRLDQQRAAEARPIPRSRSERLREAKRRLEEEHQVECQANADYEAYRVRGVMKDGRRFGRPPNPHTPPPMPPGKVNVTDPDSRNVKTPRGWVQGYSAQVVCNESQIVVAAEVNVDSPDFGHLGPMVDAAEQELVAVGVSERPSVVLADAGYWHQEQMDDIAARGTTVLIPPDAGKRKGARPGWDGGRYAFMRRVLKTDVGRALYGKRQGMIEPVFANTKFNRRIDRFLRRGRAACRSEWRLIAATHNLPQAAHRHRGRVTTVELRRSSPRSPRVAPTHGFKQQPPGESESLQGSDDALGPRPSRASRAPSLVTPFMCSSTSSPPWRPDAVLLLVSVASRL